MHVLAPGTDSFSWISLPSGSHLLLADEVILWATRDWKRVERWRGASSLFLEMHVMRLHLSQVAAPVTCHTHCSTSEWNPASAALNTKQPLRSPRVIRCLRLGFPVQNHGVRVPSSGALYGPQLLSVTFFLVEVFNIWGVSLNCEYRLKIAVHLLCGRLIH